MPTSHQNRFTTHHSGDDSSLGERITAFLRREHPNKTADAVEAETGIPRNTVAGWLRIGSPPSGEAMAALIGAYGLRLLAVMLPDARWLDDAFQAERLAQLQADHERIGREIEALRR